MKQGLCEQLSVWFITGSQHLYGPEALVQVGDNSGKIVDGLNKNKLPLPIVCKPIVTTAEEIRNTLADASHDRSCAGVILWMHTFSPSKMWIGGLNVLNKPVLHLHTQFNRDLPWGEIDMDFMNLNQAAHGDREHGFIHTRMRLPRKVVAGHWSDPEVVGRIDAWQRAVIGWNDWQGARFVRFGDNMRDVAVTEGDKVGAEMRLGYSVNTYPLGDLVGRMDGVSEKEVDELCDVYDKSYTVAAELRRGGKRRNTLREAARIELAIRGFLVEGNFKGFTTTFEDLHGLTQLPGLASQRLMADGYGFGAEGDWKTCALLRAMKSMATGLKGGTSWMEDYTYHLDPKQSLILGSHMLEVCPTIAAAKPALRIEPLGIGGKDDPPRLVFTAKAGRALNATMVDMGNRFRLLVNELDVIKPPQPLKKLPVASATWAPLPDFKTSTEAWILSGGAHHSAFSAALKAEVLEDFATIAGIEYIRIGEGSTISALKNELRWNEVAYLLLQGVRN
ncbi:MAG: L-arabinose isomerase [Lentisphaerae bacterium]|nr:L-arabinose isomerase [Lentisphaerota bacterium]